MPHNIFLNINLNAIEAIILYNNKNRCRVQGRGILEDLFRPLTVANRKIDRQRARVYIPLTYGIYTLYYFCEVLQLLFCRSLG